MVLEWNRTHCGCCVGNGVDARSYFLDGLYGKTCCNGRSWLPAIVFTTWPNDVLDFVPERNRSRDDMCGNHKARRECASGPPTSMVSTPVNSSYHNSVMWIPPYQHVTKSTWELRKEKSVVDYYIMFYLLKGWADSWSKVPCIARFWKTATS